MEESYSKSQKPAQVSGPGKRLASPSSFVMGSGMFALGLVLAWLLHQSSLMPLLLSRSCAAVSEVPSQRKCQRFTASGLCVEDVFDAIDDVYHDMWPGSVDLLLRSYVSDKFFLMETLFKSIDQMWPKNIGDVVLVLDVGDEVALSIIPSWIKVFFEENYLQLPGKVLQQWSYGWADLYTTADFVAIVDDDVVFNMKVTPSLLFNLTEGRPYVIGSNRDQTKVWHQWTNFLVGDKKYVANFMVQLPFIVPRTAFAEFRKHVGDLHQSSYDKAFKWFSEHAKEFGKDQIQHAAMGNYLYHHQAHKVHIALEWTPHTPIPRVAAHIPYSIDFYNRLPTKKVKRRRVKMGVPKVADLYGQVCSYYALEGLCHSLPKGEIPGCQNMTGVQTQVWMYAFDWADWPLIYKEQGTVLYDQHIRELHCIFDKMVEMKRKGLFVRSVTKKREVVEYLEGCVSKEHKLSDGQPS